MNKYFWLGLLPLHVFLVLAIISTSNWYLIFLFWVLLSGYGVGVTLHRLLSHKAFKTSPVISNVLSFISCFCVQGSTIFWVNVHRGYHHRYSDTTKDIHSPLNGKLWSYILWTCKIDTTSLNYKYVPDLLRSKFHMWMSTYYFYIIWAGWVVAYLISPIIFFSLIIAQVITMHLEFCVNLFCHSNIIPGSYRNFNTLDNSVNYWLFGLLCWGIGYHNNHHGNPNDYNFAHTRYEFDPTVILVNTIKVE